MFKAFCNFFMEVGVWLCRLVKSVMCLRENLIQSGFMASCVILLFGIVVENFVEMSLKQKS